MRRFLAAAVALVLVFSAGCSGSGSGSDDAGGQGDSEDAAASSEMSDEEFAEAAASICDVFATESAEAQEPVEDLVDAYDRAGLFQTAAASLRELEATEESAPDGVALIVGLEAAGEAWEAFDAAYREAFAEVTAGGATVTRVFTTVNGEVYFTTDEGVESLEKSSVDPALFLDVVAAESEVGEAADALGLPGCVPPELF